MTLHMPQQKTMLDQNTQHQLLEDIGRNRDIFLRYLSRKVSSLEDQEDILHHAYNKAVRYIHTLKSEDLAHAWFRGILRHSIADFYTSKQKVTSRRQVLTEDPTFCDDAPGDDAFVAPINLCHCSEKLIQEFSSETIELITRVDLNDEKPSEVAPSLGLTPNAARVKLHRAHTKIRQRLQEHCTTPGDGTRYQDYLECQCVEC